MQLLHLLALAILAATNIAYRDRELEKLQGTWRVVKAEVDEREIPEEKLGGAKITFVGTKLYYFENGKKELMGTIIIRPEKSPKWMDTKIVAGINTGKTAFAIYEANGNQLRLCDRAPMRKRPRQFSSKNLTNLLFLEKEMSE